MIELPICPYCKMTSETTLQGYASGSIQRMFDANGEIIHDSYDNLRFEMSQVVRCMKCRKIRHDLICKDGWHVEIKRE